ncbi:conserved Plasmodium protein, unknown function [Plasmodium reichenowi]|uniref:Uroporphyrinogen-III synthase n=1 Tax=Plasmodium reichenowi TaxID=5854 RepID=A0A060S1M5_PLARE|nr:conserved Plasmodium protein, unknown function [Plasmodium reichenowi]
MKYSLFLNYLILLLYTFFNSFLALKFITNYKDNFSKISNIKKNNYNILKFFYILPEQVRKKYISYFILSCSDKDNIKRREKRIKKDNMEYNKYDIKEDVKKNGMCDITNDNVISNKNRFIKKANTKLYILITSPEAARIYRYIVILLIHNLKNRNLKCETCNERKLNYIKKYIEDIPILSIGNSCNHILENKFNKSLFYYISNKNSCINKSQIFKIKKEKLLQINRDISTHLNIVFTPTKANGNTFKKELRDFFFFKKKEKRNNNIYKKDKQNRNVNINQHEYIIKQNVQINKQKIQINKKKLHNNILWISSSISTSSFHDLDIHPQNDNHIYDRINLKRINCYDTQQVIYNINDKTNKIHIKKYSIICLMSTSTVLSFYKNFGNNFDYVVCMGKSSYELLKKLNFKNIYFPENSKTQTLLNILITLYHKLNNKYKRKFHIILTRQKDKNEEIKNVLSQQNIPLQEIPCIKTKYNFANISKLYNLLYSYINHAATQRKRTKMTK